MVAWLRAVVIAAGVTEEAALNLAPAVLERVIPEAARVSYP
jgi:hypothetical protein